MAKAKEKEKVKGFRFSNFRTSESKEVEGVWIEFAPGFKVKVARIGNPKFEVLMARLRRPHLNRIRRNAMDDATARMLMQQAMARTILLDWKGLLDDDDKEIPFSEQKAGELLETPDFFSEIIDLANDAEQFKEEEQEDASGN